MNNRVEDHLSNKHKEVWRLFLTAHARLLERIDRDVSAAGGVSLDWYDVLLTLEESPEGRLRMGELGESVLLSRSGLTRLVDRIEKAGYLRREADPTDRRATLAVLTEAGREVRERTWPAYSQAIVRYFACYLSDAEATTIGDALKRMIAGEEQDVPA